MTRSERLALIGKVTVDIGSLEEATVIKDCCERSDIRYIGTDFECLYDGREVSADVYESDDGDLYAVIN
jgi:hypothetical protein